LDLAFAGVIKLATWNGVDRVEVLEDSVAASLLAIQGIIENSKRPNKGKGTYIAQKEMVKADADKEFAKLSTEKRPDLAALYLCVSVAVSHAARIVRMSRLPSVPPSNFVGSFVRLEDAIERWSSMKELPALLSQLPKEPKGFTWGRRTSPSAITRGITFAEKIHRAANFGRNGRVKEYWDHQPVSDVPGEEIIRWTELAMRELREHAAPLNYVWPSLGDIDEDTGQLLYAIEAEYRAALATSGGPTSETPDEEALRIIYNMGRQMERLPAFRKQGEESLRSSFVSALGMSSFIATAESLNGEGKTDILVTRDGVNVLVGECKFWGGQQKYFETIDQLFGYVIHQDPNAAILLFVRGRDIDLVATQIEQSTQHHPLWKKSRGKVKDNWYDFDFRKALGSEHTTKVSVMCFHFPSDD
jgi:hypothetical protein